MPRSTNVRVNGLQAHAVEWGPSDGDLILCLHGYMDAAATWDLVAMPMAAAGKRVVALDFRGFGDGPRIPKGSGIHFPDYVLDVSEFARVYLGARPLKIVGHSMGGIAATYFAGAMPERVSHLVSLEGLGPPDNKPETVVSRMRAFLETMQEGSEAQSVDEPMSLKDAYARLVINHRTVDEATLRTRLPLLTREIAPGRFTWLHDSMHRTRSATPFFASTFCAFASAVTADTLYISGGSNGYQPPDEGARLSCFRSLRQITLEGAGHMMHWSRAAEVAAAILQFVR